MFLKRIWHDEPYSNVDDALDYLDSIDDNGSYNFSEVMMLRTRYPNVFYPIYHLQQQIMTNSLGELWWEHHKAKLLEDKIKEEKRLLKLALKKKKAHEKSLALVNDEMVRQRMGFRYYLMPWRIDAERKRCSRIAAMEQDIERTILDTLNRDRIEVKTI